MLVHRAIKVLNTPSIVAMNAHVGEISVEQTTLVQRFDGHRPKQDSRLVGTVKVAQPATSRAGQLISETPIEGVRLRRREAERGVGSLNTAPKKFFTLRVYRAFPVRGQATFVIELHHNFPGLYARGRAEVG